MTLTLPFARSIRLRAELRLALIAAGETCWLYAIGLMVGAMAGHLREVSPLGIFFVYWVGLFTGRLVPQIRQSWRSLQLLTVLIAFAAIVIAIRIGLYWDVVLADVSWLPNYFGRVLGFFERITPEVVSTLLLAAAFIRALNLAARPLTLWEVGFAFRLGIVIFFVISVLAGFAAPVDLVGPIFFYFAFFLPGIALARIEDAGQPGALGWRWAAVMLTMLAVVLLAGLALTRLVTLDTVNAFFAFISPVLIVVQAIVTLVAVPLLLVLEFLIRLLLPFLEMIAKAFSNAFPQQAQLDQPLGPALEQFSNSFASLVPYLRLLGIILMVAWIAWLIARALNKRMNRLEGELTIHEPLSDAETAEKEKRRRAAAARRPHYDTRAETVRRIYAALQAQAEALELKRREAETPLEYLPRLVERFPGSAPALKTITDLYVAVHYAQQPATEDEVRELRRLWQTTRDQMRATEVRRKT